MKIEELHKNWRESKIPQLEKEKDFGYFATDKAQKDFGEYCIEQLSLANVSSRYQVTDIQLADWESVTIGDTKTKKVICHFITENGFDEAFGIAKKITKFLNGC